MEKTQEEKLREEKLQEERRKELIQEKRDERKRANRLREYETVQKPIDDAIKRRQFLILVKAAETNFY